MSLISINGSLKQSIEAASGGAQTVLVTPKGQLTYMNVINKFNMSSIDPSLTGTHPAFIVNGVEKEKLYIGTYPGTIKNGELLSLPNTDCTVGQSLATLLNAVRSIGQGHHLMTAVEYGALAMQAALAGKEVQGNTYLGRSGLDASQYGRRVDGQSATAGINNSTGVGGNRILSGSGPVSFRHNNRYNGVSDLVGNSAEFCAGMRLVNSEFQIFTNNDAALFTADLLDGGAWKAIDGATGNLITPNGSGTTPGSVRITITTTPATAPPYSLIVTSNAMVVSGVLNNSPTPIPTVTLNKLKTLGLLHVVDAVKRGYYVINPNQNITAYVQRGGGPNESGSGILQSSFVTTIPTPTTGPGVVRPCYYEP